MKEIQDIGWWHDDGIFRYRKQYVWDPIQPVPQSAQEVIERFREREKNWQKEAQARREEWESLPENEQKKPWVTIPPPPRVRKSHERLTMEELLAEEEYKKNLQEARDRQPERFRTVWLDAGSRETNLENEKALNLGVFPTPREPDYPDLSTAGYYHESFCWTIALLSAFRILDLYGMREGEFPFGWVHIDCPPNHPNHVSLVASASYQMGIYFTKAQAMQRIPQICRSVTMTKGRKGKTNPFGETVLQACAEMHSMGISLQKNKASSRVLKHLVEQGVATFDPPTVGGEDAPAWKLNRFITKFLKSNRLYLGKTRSAKNAE